MAYKYQQPKDEMFVSDDDDDEDDGDAEAAAAQENGLKVETVSLLAAKTEVHQVIEQDVGAGMAAANGEDGGANTEAVAQLAAQPEVHRVIEQDGVFILETVEGDPDSEVKLESVAQLPSNTKVKQVIEQDGVFILETMEADPGDSVPMGAAILAEGATVVAEAAENTSMEGDSSMDDSAILAELENGDNVVEVKPGKKKNILEEQGEKVECQLCSKSIPAGNLRWHILKEHCHNKVRNCMVFGFWIVHCNQLLILGH